MQDVRQFRVIARRRGPFSASLSLAVFPIRPGDSTAT